MSTTNPPTQPKKRSGATTALMAIGGIIAMVAGGLQMYRGVSEIRSAGEDPQLKQLADESDQALAKANQLAMDVNPRFQRLLDEFDSLGVDAFRKQKRDEAQKVSDEFGQAAEQFSLAAQKLDAAAGHNLKDAYKPIFADKSRVYTLSRQVCEKDQQIIGALLDDSLKQAPDVLAKIQPVVTERDAIQKQANEAAATADAKLKELNQPKS